MASNLYAVPAEHTIVSASTMLRVRAEGTFIYDDLCVND